MIHNYEEYKNFVKSDYERNREHCGKNDKILLEHSYYIMKFLKLLRKDEFYSNSRKIIHKIMKLIIRRKRNRLGVKLGFTIPINTFGKGLIIWHYGNIVVNGYAHIGNNCTLHGDNCIGNDGSRLEAPTIGDNVDIGVGAKIIGNIHIASNIKIGAGAVVVNSFYEEGITIVGVPARKVV